MLEKQRSAAGAGNGARGDEPPSNGLDPSHVRADRPKRYTVPEMLGFGLAVNLVANVLGPPSSAKEIYANSTRPPFAPPSWAFGVAWPINNFLTLWANREVLNAPPSPNRTAYLKLQAATWTLFASYGLVRFRLKSPILGYAVTTAYLALTIPSAVRASRIDRTLLASFATLGPWLVVATILSAYELNDPDPLFGG